MRLSLSRPRRARRFVPRLQVELLEQRNPASLLWVGAAAATAGQPPAPPQARIAWAAPVQTPRADSLDAILTPTNRLSLLPANGAGATGGSAHSTTEVGYRRKEEGMPR